MASTAALAGSVVDAKSLTDTASARITVVPSLNRERDLSPTAQQGRNAVSHGLF